MQNRNIIITQSGAVNAELEIRKLTEICREMYGMPLDPRDENFLDRFGGRLIVVAGSDAAFHLVDELEGDGRINSDFAAMLRQRWTEIVERCS